MADLIIKHKEEIESNMTVGDCCEDLLVVIPAYNEEKAIGSIVLKAKKYAGQVLVIDDGSEDDTAEVARAAGATVISHEANLGKGNALNTAFRAAGGMDFRVLATIDGDGQHLADELERVIKPVGSGKADVVVGSRYLEATSDVPRHRVLGHKVFNLITRVASGIHVTDSQSGYRAFSRKAVEAINFSSKGFSVESEMQFLVNELGLTIEEVPITIEYDERPKRPVVQHGFLVLNGILRLIGQYRPLLFFGVPGLLMLISGLGTGLVIVNIYDNTRQLAVGYALVSVVLFILGSTFLSTGLILHTIRTLLLEMEGRRRQNPH